MTRVLSLDDDPEMLSLLGLIFGLCGYDHMRTTNSAEALSILQREPIDLFTQDCTRPDMHGLELYRLLKVDEDMARIPVLFISFWSNEVIFQLMMLAYNLFLLFKLDYVRMDEALRKVSISRDL